MPSTQNLATDDVWRERLKRADAETECLRIALKNLVIGIDRAQHDDAWECLPCDIYEAYIAARETLGKPAVFYPGGEWDEHYHALEWVETDGCYWCEQHGENEADAQALLAGPKDDVTLDAMIETIRTN